MNKMLEKGKLRERVKSFEVAVQDALNAFLALKRQGEFASEAMIKWLRNFNPANHQQQSQSQKQRRKKGSHGPS